MLSFESSRTTATEQTLPEGEQHFPSRFPRGQRAPKHWSELWTRSGRLDQEPRPNQSCESPKRKLPEGFGDRVPRKRAKLAYDDPILVMVAEEVCRGSHQKK